MRVALWLRVSTTEQTVENQRMQLMQLADHRGLEVVHEYDLSGVSAWQNRLSGYVSQVIEDAPVYGFKTLLVASLDRLSRRGAGDTLMTLKRLEAANIGVLSMREPIIDTAGPFGDVIVSLFAVFAQLESQYISERTKAGMARAKAQGKQIGRPKGSKTRRKHKA